MKFKSYFADTIEEAISLARREMGPEAMLLNSKRSGAEARHLGAYEVVCAAETESSPQSAERDSARFRQTPASPPIDRLSGEVSELKQQMERLALTLARSGAGMAGIASDPALSKAFATLTDAELDADLAYEVMGRISSPPSPEALREELGRLFQVDAELGRPGAEPRMVAFVGPPGAGKTTALVKLAVQRGIAARKPSQIFTVDTHRIAAADQLRSYAVILGIGFQVFDTTAALAQAIEECRQKELIWIDTPGLASGEMEDFADLVNFLATYPGLDTHLVLPASMRSRDLKRVADSYQIFKPGKLLFTRLDETSTFGPIVSQSVRLGKPVSFFSGGQRIPEDLEAASKERILDLILKPEPAGQTQFGVAAA